MFKEQKRRESETALERILPDHFKETPEMTFAGIHLIVDIWGASGLTDMKRIEDALRGSAKISDATLIHIHLHRFTPSGGISGMAILAESHISIHTWPEREYAAIDLFMCGDKRPELALPVLKRAFLAKRIEVKTLRRGQIRL